jgi:hypothetical protein
LYNSSVVANPSMRAAFCMNEQAKCTFCEV